MHSSLMPVDTQEFNTGQNKFLTLWRLMNLYRLFLEIKLSLDWFGDLYEKLTKKTMGTSQIKKLKTSLSFILLTWSLKT